MPDKQNGPGKNRDWGYASYYDDDEGNTRLIYTSYEKDGSVNRYKDNGDGGHSHSHWDNKDDYDSGEDPDWSRQESNGHSNPDTGEVQENGGCYLTTACMHKYKQNFDDNCYELTVLRWFRDNYVSLPDKYHYYKVAPQIVEALSNIKNKEAYYNFIYENVIKQCVLAIEKRNYKFAYTRYKTTIEILEKKLLKEPLKTIDANKEKFESKNDVEIKTHLI